MHKQKSGNKKAFNFLSYKSSHLNPQLQPEAWEKWVPIHESKVEIGLFPFSNSLRVDCGVTGTESSSNQLEGKSEDKRSCLSSPLLWLRKKLRQGFSLPGAVRSRSSSGVNAPGNEVLS